MPRKEPRLTKHGPSMETVRVSTDFYDHPKALKAGFFPSYVFLLSLMWSGRHGTAGFIPRNALPFLMSQLTSDPPTTPEEIGEKLVRVGLWEKSFDESSHGWQIHDWDEWQKEDEPKIVRDPLAKNGKWVEPVTPRS